MLPFDDDETSGEKCKIPTHSLLSMGIKYLRLHRIETAKLAFETVLRTDAHNTKALLGRAKCHLKSGQFERALLDLDHLLEVDPNCSEAIGLKGSTEYSRGDFEKAFCTYWEGYKKNPTRDRLRQGFGISRNAIVRTLAAMDSAMLGKEDVLNVQPPLHCGGLSEARKHGDARLGFAFSKDVAILEGFLGNSDLSGIHLLCEDALRHLEMKRTFAKLAGC